MENKIKCPICNGKGNIEPPKMDKTILRESMVKILLKNGFGVREVQRLVGFKSASSINFIKKKQ